MTIAAVLLAAGGSTRLGFPKQLLTIGGETLLRRAARALLEAQCVPVIVVVGANAPRMRAQVADLEVTAVENSAWRQGMGSTIRVGLEEALRFQPGLDAALLAVCDQPQVNARHLSALLEVYRRAGKPVAAAAYGEIVGVPAVFSRTLFPELLALRGAAGAKQVISTNMHNLAQFPLQAAAIDVDEPEDLEAAGVDTPTSGLRATGSRGESDP